MITDLELWLPSLLVGLILSLSTAPLGCVLVWKRWTFFGDVLGHAAILGVALSFLFHIPWFLGIFLIGVIGGLAVMRKTFDLAILSYGSLAFGLMLLSFAPPRLSDPQAILFGDILMISSFDIFLSLGAACLTLGFIILCWQDLLRFIFDEDLAKIEGVNVTKIRLLLLITLSASIACGLKIIGGLLIPGLLVIPPTIARLFSKTPKQMVLGSIVVTWFCLISGISFSFLYDLPTGPSIVVLGIIGLCVLSWKKRAA